MIIMGYIIIALQMAAWVMSLYIGDWLGIIALPLAMAAMVYCIKQLEKAQRW